MVEQIARFPKPLVAAIHGACLGGGLELALAARYRIASDAPATRLGLPEVRLGLIPAAGGCQRLPRAVGLGAALDMILTGRSVRPGHARRMGVVDEVVPQSILRSVATATAARLASGWRPRRRSRRRVQTLLLDRNPIGRWLICRLAGARVIKRTGGHYPAPLVAIDAIRHGLVRGHEAGLTRESALFGQLAVGVVARHLVQIFFATTALKKDTGGIDFSGARSVERLGIVGAGFMGAGIAGVAVLAAGVDVRLRDTNWDHVARGLAAARHVLGQAVRRRRLDAHERYRRASLLSGAPVPSTAGFRERDLVIEAVFEDVDVKRRTIADLERIVADRCVLASNTSTIPIGRLQDGARRPERIVGMHFFSPVERMPLLEVIRGPSTADWATATAVGFGRRLGKTVIVVQDTPGFWVNRILAPYLNEAGWLLEEGARIDAIDRAMTAFGFPIGPLALLDEVGLDVAGKANSVLSDALGARLVPAPVVGRLIKNGRLGRKSGRGFYRYERSARRRPEALFGESGHPGAARRPSPAETARRPILVMLNEAARALSEGSVSSPRDGDIGAVMGFGFPPFLGGPLRHIDALGAAVVVAELEQYASRIGPRFAPAEVLVEMARAEKTFYH
jgi:3-hydroxyacyl-CoA dehydrogenase/enoyl-CoA hydratase/3-hydroxybutyryl-CoA epimerase